MEVQISSAPCALYDQFGMSVVGLGDVDGDGVRDIAVGCTRDNGIGSYRGAVYIIMLNTNGSVKSYKKLSSASAPFSSILDNDDQLGVSLKWCPIWIMTG